MKEILFKAKRIKTGEWIEGFYLSDNDLLPGAYICPKLTTTCREKGEMLMGGFAPVAPSTVCQHTGLTDRDGVKVFEGDLLSYDCGDGDTKLREVRFLTGKFVVQWVISGTMDDEPYQTIKMAKVVGLIHEKEAPHDH